VGDGMSAKKIIEANLQDKLLEMGGWLIEKKALDMTLIDLQGQNPLTEGIIMAGASSIRHAQGLADFLLEKCGERGYEFLHMEGYKNGLWILLDFNDVIANIMQPAQRELYRLEELFPHGRVIPQEKKHA
jgi:ribosome-associated protein